MQAKRKTQRNAAKQSADVEKLATSALGVLPAKTTAAVASSAQLQRAATLTKKLLMRSNKEFGEGTFRTLDTASSNITRYYDTGIVALNVVISGYATGGFPGGRMVEVYGDEHIGKTTLGCNVIRQAQKAGGIAVFFDTEATFTKDRAVSLGVDLNSLLYGEEEYLEPILDEVLKLTTDLEASNTPVVIFWDTIAGTASLSEKGRNVGDGAIARHARALSAGLRKISRPLSKSNVLLLACNQLKLGGIGDMFASARDRDATLGGKAVRFHSGMRIRMEHTKDYAVMVASKRVKSGYIIRASVVKDKDKASNVKCREAMLVFKSIGNDGGNYSNALSSLFTLKNWGALPSKDVVEFCNKKYTTDAWEAQYIADSVFRERVAVMLESCFKRMMQRYDSQQPDTQQSGVVEED